MKANYNVTGNDRKALVAAIENLTGDKAIYMRMPTCAYEIGDITVDKEGSVTCEDADKLERIMAEFEATYPQVLDKLKSAYPDLNENECTVAVLNFLGFRIKEEAVLLNLSENTVMKYRSNLKKTAGSDPISPLLG